MIAVSLLFEFGQRRFPLFLGNLIGILVLLAKKLFGVNFGVAAEENIGASAGHIGGYGYRALASGLGDDGGFTLVILGVEDLMLHAHLLEDAGEPLRFLDRDGADERGLADIGALLDLLSGIAKFFVFGEIDQVRVIDTNHRHVRRNHDHVELIGLSEFRGFR